MSVRHGIYHPPERYFSGPRFRRSPWFDVIAFLSLIVGAFVLTHLP